MIQRSSQRLDKTSNRFDQLHHSVIKLALSGKNMLQMLGTVEILQNIIQ